MAESKVKRENFIHIGGWMLTDLHLKGNELLIYAIIYGFSQDGEQTFSGSLQYLADWTNSTKQGVSKSLKSLVDKGLIDKIEKFVNGVKFCEYRTTKFNGVYNKVTQGMQQSLMGGMQQSLTNNIDTDNTENKNRNNNRHTLAVREIVEYLNQKAGMQYRSGSKATQQHINARLAEGYTVEDFKTVIDKKCADWKGTDYEQYLRPSTLFGTKFENYLNAARSTRTNQNQQSQQNGQQFQFSSKYDI